MDADTADVCESYLEHPWFDRCLNHRCLKYGLLTSAGAPPIFLRPAWFFFAHQLSDSYSVASFAREMSAGEVREVKLESTSEAAVAGPGAALAWEAATSPSLLSRLLLLLLLGSSSPSGGLMPVYLIGVHEKILLPDCVLTMLW